MKALSVINKHAAEVLAGRGLVNISVINTFHRRAGIKMVNVSLIIKKPEYPMGEITTGQYVC